MARRAMVAALAGMFAVSMMVMRGARAQSGAAQANSAPKKAEEQYKNIQVLKGTPADEVIPGMQLIAASLGVECDFCHVQGAFEKDDKKTKQTARKMMEMMITINQENFDGHREVTCYSCHRGNAKPATFPAVMTEDPKEPAGGARTGDEAEAKAPTGPAADQLIEKYVQAVGGAAAIDKVTSREQTGKIIVGGKEMPIDIYSKDPEKRISFVHMASGDSITAFDGQAGWLGAPGRPVREMHGPDLDGAAIDADMHFAAHLKQMFSEVKTRGTEKIGEQETYFVEGKRDGKTPIELYFDEQSGLLVRLVRYGETPFGVMPTQIDYADYRAVNGVKIPFRWTLARPNGRFTIQVSEVMENVPVEDARFVKPAEEPKGPAK